MIDRAHLKIIDGQAGRRARAGESPLTQWEPKGANDHIAAGGRDTVLGSTPAPLPARTPAPPREWSQRPGNVQLVETFAREHCPDCAGRESAAGIVALLWLLLVCSNAIWVVLWAVRKGWIS